MIDTDKLREFIKWLRMRRAIYPEIDALERIAAMLDKIGEPTLKALAEEKWIRRREKFSFL